MGSSRIKSVVTPSVAALLVVLLNMLLCGGVATWLDGSVSTFAANGIIYGLWIEGAIVTLAGGLFVLGLYLRAEVQRAAAPRHATRRLHVGSTKSRSQFSAAHSHHPRSGGYSKTLWQESAPILVLVLGNTMFYTAVAQWLANCTPESPAASGQFFWLDAECQLVQICGLSYVLGLVLVDVWRYARGPRLPRRTWLTVHPHRWL